MEELAEVATTKDDGALSEIRMPKINSGLFAVPWEETEGVLVGLKTRASVPTKMFVYEQGQVLRSRYELERSIVGSARRL